MSRSKAIVRRPQAELDIVEIALHLDGQSESVARRFLAAVPPTTQRIAAHPAAGDFVPAAAPQLTDCRSWPVVGFENWRVYYLVRADRIEIVRVLHVARDLESL